jgi:Protein of unknown function (DUF4242)
MCLESALPSVVTTRSRQQEGELDMPRYLIERTFPEGMDIPITIVGAQRCLDFVDNNTREHVSWVHSYVTPDKSASFCIYDAPTPEAIRSVAMANRLPVDRITEVRVLSPFFYM